MRKFLHPLLFLLFASTSFAQDPGIFSQFYSAPLQINPAFAGTTYAPRISLNHRNHFPSWPQAFSTYAISYEQSVENLNSGFGLMVLGDSAGDGLYKTNTASAIYGYKVELGSGYFIRFGIEAGFIQTLVDWDRLVFLDQIDEETGAVDASGNPYLTEEVQPETLDKMVLDISAGILFYSENFYAGASLKHMNTPDKSFFELNQNLWAGLPMRLGVHAGTEILLDAGNKRSGPTFISPNILFIKQGPFGQINGGAYAGLGKIFGGLWYRHAFSNPDAAIFLVGFRQGIFRIGYSFDMSLSELSGVNTGGTHEISLTLNFDNSSKLKSKRRSSRYNDCFRMFR